jgi:hypothetical protein
MRYLLILLPMVLALPAAAQGQTESADAQLCWNQLDLLLSREKLTEDEQHVFEAQCDCLDVKAKSGDQTREECAQPHE